MLVYKVKTSFLGNGDESEKQTLFTLSTPNLLPNSLLNYFTGDLNHPIYSVHKHMLMAWM
jgi:hypothetical protein